MDKDSTIEVINFYLLANRFVIAKKLCALNVCTIDELLSDSNCVDSGYVDLVNLNGDVIPEYEIDFPFPTESCKRKKQMLDLALKFNLVDDWKVRVRLDANG